MGPLCLFCNGANFRHEKRPASLFFCSNCNRIVNCVLNQIPNGYWFWRWYQKSPTSQMDTNGPKEIDNNTLFQNRIQRMRTTVRSLGDSSANHHRSNGKEVSRWSVHKDESWIFPHSLLFLYIHGLSLKLPCVHHIHFLPDLLCNKTLLTHTNYMVLVFDCIHSSNPSQSYLHLRYLYTQPGRLRNWDVRNLSSSSYCHQHIHSNLTASTK